MKKLRLLNFLLLLIPFLVSGKGLNDHSATYAFASFDARILWPDNDFEQQFSRSGALTLGSFSVDDTDKSRPLTIKITPQKFEGTITLAIRSQVNNNGIATFFSKEAGNKTAPMLMIRTSDKQHVVKPLSDTFVGQSVRHPQADKTALKAGRDSTVLLQFEIPAEIHDATDIDDAELSLYLTQRQHGNSHFDVIVLSQPRALPAQKLNGIANRYTHDKGILEDPEVYYADDFDSQGLFASITAKLGLKSSQWGNTGELEFTDHAEINHFLAVQGKSLVAPFSTKKNLATNLDYIFAQHHSNEPEEAYFRYYVKLQGGSHVSGGGKFPGFGGTYNKAGWGGRANNGKNGWSARGAFFATVSKQDSPWYGRLPTGSYLYEIDTYNRYGQTIPWGKALSALEPGKWHSIEQRLKLNTVDRKDGVLQVWIDGHEVFHRQDMYFRTDKSLRIEKIWFNFYFGGRDKPTQDFTLFVDNIVIASAYIGPIKK